MSVQTQDQAAVADNKSRRDSREAARKTTEDQYAKDRADMEKRNLEKMQADSKLRPTPTIEEIHQALAGHNKDVKEPDGAPLQNERHHTLNPAQQIEVGREQPSAQPVPGNMTPAEQADYDRKLDHSKTKAK